MKDQYQFYPILINGEPYNVVVRSERQAFDSNDAYRTIPSTIAFSIDNQGTTILTIDNTVVINPGDPPYNIGGDLFARRDDEVKLTFSGVGTNNAVVTQDLAIRLAKLEFV